MNRMFSTIGCLTVKRAYSRHKCDGLIFVLKQQQKENKGRYEGGFFNTHIFKPHKILVAASAIKINGFRILLCYPLQFHFITILFFLPLFQFLSFYLPKLFGVPVFMSFISLISLVGQNF